MRTKTKVRSLRIGITIILIVLEMTSYLSFYKIERVLESRPTYVHDQDSLTVYNSPVSRELRKNALKTAENDRKVLLTASQQDKHRIFYDAVKMEAHCPVKERIGEQGDGGKYVCNPKLVKKDCTLLSLGLNNQIGYDKHIYDVTGKQCTILGADQDAQNADTKASYDEMKGQLFAGKIPEPLTIPSILQKSRRNEVELLKIDIEGGEFTGLEPLISEYLVCQIFIELHGTPAEQLKMLRLLSKYGFRLFNIDENPICPSCCEYSLINEICMAQFQIVPLGNVIPEIDE